MDAPAGLQQPSEGNPFKHDSPSLIGPRFEHSRLSAGVAAAGFASDSSPGSTRGFDDDPTRALHQHQQDTDAWQLKDTTHD
ncbi:hypothetical protein AA0117_g4086 [Alternaria alternata]|uniref:Uncharacterized protein n=1 Tax=Alternaria alternata TaxID=5599 RepID=A0A4Q4NL16_ALTAL|nr:hypothetical protein AA0117_g4086 [Alternaria alternata]